jgi:hypothetical protein
VKPETKFRNNKVLPFLNKLPNCYHDGIQQMSKSGSPDYYLCINCIFVGLELKSEGDGCLGGGREAFLAGGASPLQAQKLHRIERAGGVSLVCSPNNWEEVKDKLYQLSQETQGD